MKWHNKKVSEKKMSTRINSVLHAPSSRIGSLPRAPLAVVWETFQGDDDSACACAMGFGTQSISLFSQHFQRCPCCSVHRKQVERWGGYAAATFTGRWECFWYRYSKGWHEHLSLCLSFLWKKPCLGYRWVFTRDLVIFYILLLPLIPLLYNLFKVWYMLRFDS